MAESIERHRYDVVVIGAGGAGLRAAIEARLAGKRTAIISKSLFGKAHTVMAEGGAAAAMGNVILVGNVVLLWAYTVSCHSCRHIVGGRLKHFSKHPVRYRAWTFVSKLNTRHKELAWITLGSLALADFYVMGLAAGWWSDLRFIN